MIKAVFFDLDNTLYDFSTAHQLAWKKLEQYCEQELSVSSEDMNREMKKEMDRCVAYLGIDNSAIHNRHIRYQKVLQQLGKPIFPYADRMYHAYWDTVLDHVHLECGADKLLGKLRERGIRMAVGTNMTAMMQYKKIERLGIGSFFDDVISSEEAGCEKPNPHFFLYCADRLGLAPGECAFIGDSLKTDVQGAAGAGMHAFLYRPNSARERVMTGSLTLDPGGESLPASFPYETLTDYNDLSENLSILLGA